MGARAMWTNVQFRKLLAIPSLLALMWAHAVVHGGFGVYTTIQGGCPTSEFDEVILALSHAAAPPVIHAMYGFLASVIIWSCLLGLPFVYRIAIGASYTAGAALVAGGYGALVVFVSGVERPLDFTFEVVVILPMAMMLCVALWWIAVLLCLTMWAVSEWIRGTPWRRGEPI